jgi:hypothetical protein
VKPMVRRLRLLEKALMASDDDQAEDGPAALVRARRMRRLQMEGEDVTSKRFPHLPLSPFHRNTTLAEMIRYGRYGPRQVQAEGAL